MNYENEFVRAVLGFRDRLGKPSSEEVTAFTEHTIVPIGNGAMEAMDNKVAVRSRLLAFKEERRINTGHLPSQANLCRTYIEQFVLQSYMQTAYERIQQRDTAQFRFFYDFAMGMNEVIGRLQEAEGVRAGFIDEMFQLRREQSEGVFNEEELDTRADEYAVFSDEVEKAATLSEEDPSGFLLIDRTLDDLERDESLYRSSRTKEFYLAGAQLVAFLYKNSYEIAEDLYH